MRSLRTIEIIEGTLSNSLWFHYDLENDVLSFCPSELRNQERYGEETDNGFTEFTTETGEFAGLTIVNYWRRFGQGKPTELSLTALQEQMRLWLEQHPMAA